VATWLEGYAFAPEHVRATEAFYCGPEEWEREAADWIAGKGADSVLDFHGRGGCYIMLYGTGEHGLVGFGSIKETLWNWPTPSDHRARISMIPMLGIQAPFRGQPRGVGERRFSEQIIDDLVAEALGHPERQPFLGLYVHPRNQRAIDFYDRVGFSAFHKTWTNPVTGLVYPSMLRDLRNTPVED
jgi:ribosomal protein S18 acetylase RimI-like enzyme